MHNEQPQPDFEIFTEINPAAETPYITEEQYDEEKEILFAKLEFDKDKREKFKEIDHACAELKNLVHEQTVIKKEGNPPQEARYNNMTNPKMVIKYLKPAYDSIMEGFTELVGIDLFGEQEMRPQDLRQEQDVIALYLLMLNYHRLNGVKNKIALAERNLGSTTILN